MLNTGTFRVHEARSVAFFASHELRLERRAEVDSIIPSAVACAPTRKQCKHKCARRHLELGVDSLPVTLMPASRAMVCGTSISATCTHTPSINPSTKEVSNSLVPARPFRVLSDDCQELGQTKAHE